MALCSTLFSFRQDEWAFHPKVQTLKFSFRQAPFSLWMGFSSQSTNSKETCFFLKKPWSKCRCACTSYIWSLALQQDHRIFSRAILFSCQWNVLACNFVSFFFDRSFECRCYRHSPGVLGSRTARRGHPDAFVRSSVRFVYVLTSSQVNNIHFFRREWWKQRGIWQVLASQSSKLECFWKTSVSA